MSQISATTVYTAGSYDAVNPPLVWAGQWHELGRNNNLAAALSAQNQINFDQIKFFLRKDTLDAGRSLSGSLAINIYARSANQNASYAYYPVGDSLGSATISNSVLNALPLKNQHYQEVLASFTSPISLSAGEYFIVVTASGDMGTAQDDKFFLFVNNTAGGLNSDAGVGLMKREGESVWSRLISSTQGYGDWYFRPIIKLERRILTLNSSESQTFNGKNVTKTSSDPRVTPVLKSDGSALPAGSIVRNLLDNKKFMKKSGGETAYAAIEATVPVAWKWESSSEAVWSLLQGF